jgi:HPt (histidine-containing phosphotransfer) domain-containing protein
VSPANSSDSDAPAGDESAARVAGEATISLARIERLRSSMPDKAAIVNELIDLFVSDLPRRLAAIADAIEHEDVPALALQAHALRGSAANFGAARLDELCAGLEELESQAGLAQAPAILEQVRAEGARVRDALLALKSAVTADSA